MFLLDNTASMRWKVPATVKGFNTAADEAFKAARENNISSSEVLMLFGEQGHFVVKDSFKKLTDNSTGIAFPKYETVYNPTRPATALWWAVVQAINWATIRLHNSPKGTQIVLSIFTDGDNNSAYEYETEAKRLVQEKQQEGWVINFIGAGSEWYIKRMSERIGIFANNTLAYNNTSLGTAVAFDKMSFARRKFAKAYTDGVATTMNYFENT